jgi:hypothetical protein
MTGRSRARAAGAPPTSGPIPWANGLLLPLPSVGAGASEGKRRSAPRQLPAKVPPGIARRSGPAGTCQTCQKGRRERPSRRSGERPDGATPRRAARARAPGATGKVLAARSKDAAPHPAIPASSSARSPAASAVARSSATVARSTPTCRRAWTKGRRWGTRITSGARPNNRTAPAPSADQRAGRPTTRGAAGGRPPCGHRTCGAAAGGPGGAGGPHTRPAGRAPR